MDQILLFRRRGSKDPKPTLSAESEMVEIDSHQIVLARLIRDAQILCRPFDLRFTSIEAEKLSVKRRYGICYADGRIKIRLHDRRTGGILRYSSLVDTLCHELAHLRYMNHGPRFQRLYRRILQYARNSRIYQPQQRAQKSVFDFES